MTRQKFQALLIASDGRILAEKIAYAHNSGVRASEALVREHARAHGSMFHGERSQRDGSGYHRAWVSTDGTVRVIAAVRAVS